VAKASEKWGPEKIDSDMALGYCGGGCNVGSLFCCSWDIPKL